MNLLQSDWKITEDTVQRLLKREKQFREEWAGIATRSRPFFDEFLSKGASLPDRFLDQLSDLEKRKTKLHQEIQAATADVPSSEWSCPEASASLHDLEAALESLKTLCRTREKQQREWMRRVVGPLESISGLATDVAELRTHLDSAKEKSSQLVASLSSPEQVVIEDVEKRQQASVSLMNLVADSCRDPEQKSLSPLSLDDCAACFDTVAAEFGRQLAFAALRGQLRLPADFDRQAVSPGTEQTEVQPAVSSEQISELQKHFTEKSDQISEPRPLRRLQTAKPTPFTAMEAEQELRPAVRQLQERLETLQHNQPVECQLDGHAVFLRAMGYQNLITVTDHLLKVLAFRDKHGRNLSSEIEATVNLLAEAQNAVRVDAQQHGEPSVSEQFVIFQWLKNFVSPEAEAIHVQKYMRLDDLASPTNNPELGSRITDQVDRWNHVRMASKLLATIADAIPELQKSNRPAALKRIDLCIQRYLQGRAMASDASLRKVLLPAADYLPDTEDDDEPGITLSAQFREVLKYLYAHIDQQIQDELERENADDVVQVSPDQKRVQHWLNGQTMVLIGGTPKPDHQKRIEEALQLKELKWVGASKTDKVTELTNQIKDARLAVLVTKLIGHKHSYLRDFCRDHRIPCVQTRKSQGYGVNQLIAVIIEQASEQLDRAA